MFLLYLSITLIIISGFLPSGELSGLFRLSSWITLIIIIIFNNLKISNNTFKRKLSLLIIIFSFGFVLYIYPYLNFYNWDQLQSLLKNVFNIFLYIISGYEFINIFHLKVNSIVSDSNLTLIKRYKKISGLLLLNTVISFCLLLLFPYLSKLILFSKHFIYMFFPDNDYGYILENIDFTSINNFGISINVSSRNAALLLPSIFLYISFYLFRKLLGISRLINNDFLISQIPKLNDRNKLFLTINYWSLVIFLLCTGSRVGIFIGYALSIIYILKIKYFLFRDYYGISNNEERKYINIQLINKNIIITLFVLSLIVGLIPYNFIFPMSCRNEIKYNTILINSTIPIKHELKQVINIFQNKESNQSNQNNNDNSSCNVSRFWEQKNISFNEFSSSSVESRLNLYKSNSIGHESIIKDILSPLKLNFLTIPLTILYLIIYFFILIRFIILNLNFNRINYSLFNFDFILFIGSIYFVFNSVISPAAAISFGALYLNPVIKRINKMI